jgi:lipopolysaccharide transport system permease protein
MYLGFAWAMARPLAMMLVFSVLKSLAKVETAVHIPYLAYLYSGLILWFFFTESVTDASASLERDSSLIRKVYYPRLISPLVPVVANLFTFAVSALPLIPIMIYYGLYPDWRIVLLPLVIVQMVLLVLGVGCVFTVLTLLSRDWHRLLNLALYLGMFVSPVIYLPEIIPPVVRWVYHANPLSGSLLAFRATLFADIGLPLLPWLYSIVFSLVVFAGGLLLFKRYERELLDRI